MNNSETGFYKGLQGFTRSDDTLLARDAGESVYYWWWAFMRLSPVFWYARETGLTPADKAVAATYEKAGNLEMRNFAKWWRDTGKDVFAEAKRPAKVRLIDVNLLEQNELYEKSVLVEIPLTIRLDTIVRQLKRELDGVHPGRKLDLLAHARSQLKLHTRKYRLRTLEIEYWVLLYRLLFPEIETWRIGDRLQISPDIKVRNVVRGATTEKRRDPYLKLHSYAGRYLYKARFTQLNAERGSFPNAEKISIPDDFQPFGPKHDREYKAAIGAVLTEQSIWHAWLKKEFGADLRSEVITRNYWQDKIRLPDSDIKRRFPKFLDGSSDLSGA